LQVFTLNQTDRKEEIIGLRKGTGDYPDDEFREIKKKLSSIEDALVRAGIQVYYSYEYDSGDLLPLPPLP
jgi:hypothetical protein